MADLDTTYKIFYSRFYRPLSQSQQQNATSFQPYEVKLTTNEQYPVPALPQLQHKRKQKKNISARNEFDAILNEFDQTQQISKSQNSYQLKVSQLRQKSDMRKSFFGSKSIESDIQ